MQGVPIFRLLRLAIHLCVGLIKCGLLFPFLDHAGRERRIQRWSAQLIAICGVSLQVNHTAQAEPVSPALIICNHISWLDIFVINSVHACRFVAKSDIRDWPLIGWLCDKSGTIFIARGKQRDVRRIYAGLVQSIHNGERVAFFPEGTTSAQGTVLPFHANLFEAAIEAQVPVQAYAIRYRDAAGNYHPAADFIGEMSFAESVLMILRHPAMHAELIRLPAVSSEGAHRRELAGTMRAKIAQALQVEI
ncbi:MAG: lysophospholipid acyltransferase family protein [Burkholderiales bacterium]|nr:lysophospholipid acyltransferase family protein [Burkholderiales bacterium]